jgi:hypothetical protein
MNQDASAKKTNASGQSWNTAKKAAAWFAKDPR